MLARRASKASWLLAAAALSVVGLLVPSGCRSGSGAAGAADGTPAPVADGAAGFWRLGDLRGTTARDSTATADGTFGGGFKLRHTGVYDDDSSADFDGATGFVRVRTKAAQDSATALSREAWVRPRVLPTGTATILRKDGQYLLRLTASGGVIFRLWKDRREVELPSPGGLVTPHLWTHVAATYDGTTMTVYVGGTARGTVSLPGPVDTSTSDLTLASSSGAYDWFSGELDEVAVYTRALTAKQVASRITDAGVARATAGPVVIDTPAPGMVADARPTFGGAAGAELGDASSVTLRIHRGATTRGTQVAVLRGRVRSAGVFSLRSRALRTGTYTVTAEQTQSGRVARSAPRTFRVNASAPPVLLAAGDIAGCDSTGDEATARILDRQRGMVAPLGDLVYEFAQPADFANCYDPNWGRQRARTRPIPGDHDYAELQTDAEPYFAYFGALAGDPKQGYYSYDLGTWHVIALNSVCSKAGGCGPTSPQVHWLKRDLAAHPRRCTLAYWHDPRFSSGAVHGSSRSVIEFWRALYAAGAELVMNGNDHGYERFTPLTPDGRPRPGRGIRQFVVGTGGRSHYRFRTRILRASRVHDGSTFGVLQLTLAPGRYSWRFLPVAGGTFRDAGSSPCH